MIIGWQGVSIDVSHVPNWLNSDFDHIELRCDTVLPVTKPGYRSHKPPEHWFAILDSIKTEPSVSTLRMGPGTEHQISHLHSWYQSTGEPVLRRLASQAAVPDEVAQNCLPRFGQALPLLNIVRTAQIPVRQRATDQGL